MKAKRFGNVGVGSITGWGACALVGALGAIKPANAEPAPLYAHMEPVMLDSGVLDNPSNEPAVVFTRILDLGPDVPWVRVLFSDANLPPGSYVRVTSLLDGDSQTLDAAGLADWGNGTAFFNGSAVRIELVAGARSAGNVVRTERLFVGEVPPPVQGGVAAICDTADDRQASTDKRVGRLLNTEARPEGENTVFPLGICTGFIIDKPAGPDDKLHLTAGHCFRDRCAGLLPKDPSYVFQFNVVCVNGTEPTCSNPNCNIYHPPAADQFPVIGDSVRSWDGAVRGTANDWAVFKCGKSNNQTTFVHQGNGPQAMFTLGDPTNLFLGSPIRITGYGADGNGPGGGGPPSACKCDPGAVPATGTRNATLQTAIGDLIDVAGTIIEYTTDACGGNSGSPIIGPGDKAFGIHTFGRLSCDGVTTNINGGTAITHPFLQDAIAALAPGGSQAAICIPTLSAWGLIILGLSVASAATVVILRRRAVSAG